MALACFRAFSGVVLAELGQLAEALVSYDRALELHLYSPDAHYNRGLALAELERDEEALVAFDQALELRPDDPDTHQVRASPLPISCMCI